MQDELEHLRPTLSDLYDQRSSGQEACSQIQQRFRRTYAIVLNNLLQPINIAPLMLFLETINADDREILADLGH
jgi:hypothetical protein